MSAAFALIGLQRRKAWAKIVTILLAAAGKASVLFAAQPAILLPVAIIAVGIYLLFVAMPARRAQAQVSRWGTLARAESFQSLRGVQRDFGRELNGVMILESTLESHVVNNCGARHANGTAQEATNDS